MKKCRWIFLIWLLVPLILFGQKSKKVNLKTPIILGSLSILTFNQYSKDVQIKMYENNFKDFSTRIDDVLQYSPVLLNAGFTLAGFEGKNSRRDKLGIFILGTGIYVVGVQGLKYAFNETRPDGGDRSFPSGHATTAFFGATLLAKEFGDQYPLIAIGGYALASSTALLRLANNKHWASDVFLGAGIGIVSAEIASYLYPLIKSKMGKSTAWNFEPVIGNNYYAARAQYTF